MKVPFAIHRRALVWNLATATATILLPASAQEVQTVVDDRVQPGAVLVPTVPSAEQRSGGWEIGAVIAAAYDSNIFLSRSDAKSDVVVRASPTVSYTQGDEKAGLGGYVRIAYRPTAVAYLDHRSDKRLDHDAAVTAGWNGKISKVSYTGGVRKLGDATADAGRQTDRTETAHELRAGWLPREKIAIEVAAGHRAADYSDPGFIDSRESYGEAAVRFAYSPKTQISMAYRGGRLDIDRAAGQTTHQLVAGIDWSPREKIRLSGTFGAEHRRTEARTSLQPVVQGRIEWQPREETKIFLTGYQREETSAYLAGQNYTLLGATAGISQRLGPKWTAQFEVGGESASYTRASGGSGFDRKDKIWFIRPSLDYRLNDEASISLFYRASDNSSTNSDFGYRQQLFGVALDYQF